MDILDGDIFGKKQCPQSWLTPVQVARACVPACALLKRASGTSRQNGPNSTEKKKVLECFELRMNLQCILLLHGYAAPPSRIRLGCANVASEIARNDRNLHRLVLDRGHILHDRAGRFPCLGDSSALRETGLPHVRRSGWHRCPRTRLFPYTASGASLRREVNAYVHEHHDARGYVEAAEGGVKDVADVL